MESYIHDRTHQVARRQRVAEALRDSPLPLTQWSAIVHHEKDNIRVQIGKRERLAEMLTERAQSERARKEGYAESLTQSATAVREQTDEIPVFVIHEDGTLLEFALELAQLEAFL